MATYAEQLAEVQAAITAILTRGQKAGAGDRALERAQLRDLEAREKRLIRLAAREARGGGVRIRRASPLG